jgi:hypothetical protein
MGLLFRIPIIRAVSVVFILSFLGCQTEKIEPQSTIALVTEAIKYLKSNSLINESGLKISSKYSELNKLRSIKSIENLKFDLISISEAFEQTPKNHFHFTIIDTSLMKFSFRDEFGNYNRYLIKYEIDTKTYVVTKREKLSYPKIK